MVPWCQEHHFSTHPCCRRAWWAGPTLGDFFLQVLMACIPTSLCRPNSIRRSVNIFDTSWSCSSSFFGGWCECVCAVWVWVYFTLPLKSWNGLILHIPHTLQKTKQNRTKKHLRGRTRGNCREIFYSYEVCVGPWSSVTALCEVHLLLFFFFFFLSLKATTFWKGLFCTVFLKLQYSKKKFF